MSVTDLTEWRARRLEPKRLLTYEELAGELNRSVRQLVRDRARGMPVAYDFGRLLFDVGECERWLRGRAA